MTQYNESEWLSSIATTTEIQSSNFIEPAREVSPVSNFLKKKGGLHHACYEIDDLDAGLLHARKTGVMIVATPAPAVAFDGRRIAWVCSKTRLLVELLERSKN